jgi:thioester reductase-like protein
MAELMKSSMAVMFIIRAQSEEDGRERIGGDVGQQTRHAAIVRLNIRFGAPPAA